MNILGIKKDIEKSFRRQSVLTIVAVGGAFIFVLVVSLWALSFAEKQRQKIYVLDQGKSLLLALQTDAILSKDVEIRDHVTRFHELMFTLSPQKQTIQENLDRAFNLADRSA
ncbi:MAG: conjugative transposon protein TraK, partial [Bacteroidales bacterium]|nr:conjugative transposon protein TraK [Bacteroidales bacterium]